MKSSYSIRELASIFRCSPTATIKHLRALNIPIITKERFKSIIQSNTIKTYNIDLYNSIELTILGKCSKPVFYIRDISYRLNNTHSGTYRYLIRMNAPFVRCGNKLVILASTALLN